MSQEIKPILSKEAEKQWNEFQTSVGKVLTDLTAISTTKVQFDSISKVTAEKEKQVKANTELNASLKQIEAAEKRLIISQSEAGKQAAVLRVETQEQNKANKEAAKSTLGLVSPYDALSKKLEEARKKAKDIGIQFGTTSKQFQEAQSKVIGLDTKIKALDASLGQSQRNVGNYQSAFSRFGSTIKSTLSAFGVVGGVYAFANALKFGVKTIQDFEKSNATLSGILQIEKSEMGGLIDQAKELGATTVKTATEVTELQIAYARLGFTQSEILDLTGATINGSIALNANLAETADLTGAMVNTFDDFSTTDAPKILDILSLATAKSALSFEKLQLGLPIVAGAANAAGVPFTKLVSLLGKLADSGIDTSSSATALRNIFIESAAQGLNYEQILEKIKGSQDKLTASNDEFGKRAAVSAAVLANNIDKTAELDEVLQNAAGTAQSMADKELDTLYGAFELLKSAVAGVIFEIDVANGFTTKLKNGVKFLADNISTIASTIGSVVKGFLAYKAVLIATNAISKAYAATTVAIRIAKIALSGGITGATRAMKLFNITTKANPLGLLATAIGLVVVAFSAFKNGAKDAAKAQRELNSAQEEGIRLVENQKSIDDRVATASKLSKSQLNNLLNDIDSELVANENKDAKVIESYKRNSDEIIKLEKNKQLEISKLQSQYENSSSGLEAEILLKRIEAIKQEIETKDILSYRDEKATSESIDNNVKKLNSQKEYVKKLISLNKTVEESSNITGESGGVKYSQVAQTDLEEIDRLTKDIEAIYQKSNGKINDIINSKIDKIVQSYENGTITAEQYIKQLEDVEKNASKDTLEYLLSDLQDLKYATTTNAEDLEEIEEYLTKVKADLRQLNLDDIKKKAQDEIDAEKKKNDDLEELAKKRAEQAKKTTELIVNTTIQAAAKIGNALFDNATDRFDAESAAAKRRYDYELLLAEQSGGTDEEINARKIKSAELLERKENEIAYRKAKLEKEQAIFNAAINIALGVTSALSQVPTGFAMAGVVAALGAVEIALIASKKIPKFKTGVENFEGGLATIGDGGREIVVMPNKEMFLAEKEMTTYLPKGTTVLNNSKTEKLLNDEKSLNLLKQIRNKKMIFNNVIKIKADRMAHNLRK